MFERRNNRKHALNTYALSDHMLIYGIMKEKARKHSARKTIRFRSYKNFDPVKYDNLLMTAPWHVGNLFDDVEDDAMDKACG